MGPVNEYPRGTQEGLRKHSGGTQEGLRRDSGGTQEGGAPWDIAEQFGNYCANDDFNSSQVMCRP